jgi:hypothetical protein
MAELEGAMRRVPGQQGRPGGVFSGRGATARSKWAEDGIIGRLSRPGRGGGGAYRADEEALESVAGAEDLSVRRWVRRVLGEAEKKSSAVGGWYVCAVGPYRGDEEALEGVAGAEDLGPARPALHAEEVLHPP